MLFDWSVIKKIHVINFKVRFFQTVLIQKSGPQAGVVNNDSLYFHPCLRREVMSVQIRE